MGKISDPVLEIDDCEKSVFNTDNLELLLSDDGSCADAKHNVNSGISTVAG